MMEQPYMAGTPTLAAGTGENNRETPLVRTSRNIDAIAKSVVIANDKVTNLMLRIVGLEDAPVEQGIDPKPLEGGKRPEIAVLVNAVDHLSMRVTNLVNTIDELCERI